MARLYYLNEDRVECVVEIPEDGAPVVVGRLPGLPIVTRNITVSRRHAEVRASGGRYVFKDLGSSNGCFFGGQRVTEHPLDDGDRVYCGNFELRFEHTALPEVEAMWDEPSAAPEPVVEAPVEPVESAAAQPEQRPADDEAVPEPLDLLDADALEPVEETSDAARRPTGAAFEAQPQDDGVPFARSLDDQVVDDGVDPFEPRNRRHGTDAAFVVPADLGQQGREASPTPSPSAEPEPEFVEAAVGDDRDAEIRRLRIEVESLSATLQALNESEDAQVHASTDEVERLRSEVERLSSECREAAALREQVDAAKGHVGALEQRVLASNERLAALADEIAGLNRQIEEKNREYQELFQRYSERMGVDEVVDGVRAELDEARAEVARLEEEASALRHREAEAQAELEAERQRGEAARSDADASQAQALADARSEVSDRVSRLEAERDALAARLMGQEATTASLIAGLGRLLDLDQANAAQLADAISGLKRQIASRDDTVQTRDTRIAALEERARGLEADLAARELELSNAQRDFRQYREEKHEESATLRALVAEYPPERFAELSDKLGRLTNENRDLRSITEDISFILGLGYQVDPEAIKREIKGLKTSIQLFQEQEADLKARMAEVDRTGAEREAEKERFMAKARELEAVRDGLRKELEETGRELKKLKAVGERFSPERFAELEQQLQKASAENDELQKANRSYLKKVSGLIEEKEGLEAKVDALNTRLFDDRKQKDLEAIIAGVQGEKDALASRLGAFESSAGGFAEAFNDKYGDWKMNLQIVTGITEDLQDELASNPIAFETVKGLARHLDLLRDGSNELKRLLYEFRERVAKE